METGLPNPEIALLRRMVSERDAAIVERDAMLAERSAELARVRAEAETHAAEIDKLRFLIRQLQRSIYGPRSEKIDPDQLQLSLEDNRLVLDIRDAARRNAFDTNASPLSLMAVTMRALSSLR